MIYEQTQVQIRFHSSFNKNKKSHILFESLFKQQQHVFKNEKVSNKQLVSFNDEVYQKSFTFSELDRFESLKTNTQHTSSYLRFLSAQSEFMTKQIAYQLTSSVNFGFRSRAPFKLKNVEKEFLLTELEQMCGIVSKLQPKASQQSREKFKVYQKDSNCFGIQTESRVLKLLK
ncbi:Hypothetical_protein [Hexamita inflata]|uniref:Hypothetical_protein n=1 Tax=Hexamita inflata TaxID=28002 RepID=A0AA86U5Y2_9EUKA|nr:Hypothetical protein HINF_LOCUS26717 [Hexamita inflata]